MIDIIGVFMTFMELDFNGLPILIIGNHLEADLSIRKEALQVV
jgi:hypothetical protein